jgi:hypothetical protein
MSLIKLLIIFDLLAIGAAVTAAWLWFKASAREQRRITADEDITSADLNRLVTAYNRSNLLNRRAALATAFSAIFLALKIMADLAITLHGSP